MIWTFKFILDILTKPTSPAGGPHGWAANAELAAQGVWTKRLKRRKLILKISHMAPLTHRWTPISRLSIGGRAEVVVLLELVQYFSYWPLTIRHNFCARPFLLFLLHHTLLAAILAGDRVGSFLAPWLISEILFTKISKC